MSSAYYPRLLSPLSILPLSLLIGARWPPSPHLHLGNNILIDIFIMKVFNVAIIW